MHAFERQRGALSAPKSRVFYKVVQSARLLTDTTTPLKVSRKHKTQQQNMNRPNYDNSNIRLGGAPPRKPALRAFSLITLALTMAWAQGANAQLGGIGVAGDEDLGGAAFFRRRRRFGDNRLRLQR